MIDHSTNHLLLSVEVMAPLDVIRQVIHRYFSFMYPRYLFPHENAFHDSFINRADQVDPSFLSLTAAMCAVTALSYPRAARMIFVGLDHPAIGDPSETIAAAHDTRAMVDQFIKVAADTRGSRHCLRADLNINDATTSFLLALAGSMSDRWAQYSLYMSECLATLQILCLRPRSDGTVKNHVDVELARRLRAAAFVHMQ
jgi:hypothetical protein